jgi:hypothetical protein
LTSNDVDDGSQVEVLLDQIAAPLASLVGDGAYDQAGIYSKVTKRHPEAHVIVSPRSTPVLSDIAENTPNQRDRHLRTFDELGRIGWQTRSGYTRRALAGSAISLLQPVIGAELRSRTKYRRVTEVAIAVHVLNRMLELGCPTSVRIR